MPNPNTTDLVPVEAEIVAPEAALIDRIEPEGALLNALVSKAVIALGKQGSLVYIKGSKQPHVTVRPLEEIAGFIGVSYAASDAESFTDPVTGKVAAKVRHTCTRPDGVSATEWGYASTGELGEYRDGSGTYQKWEDWYAVAGMAATRAKVRALAGLLRPVINKAVYDLNKGNPKKQRQGVSSTPAEVMPEYTPETEPFDVN